MEAYEAYYVVKDHKKLKKGYTTGTCAAVAAKAACFLLLAGREAKELSFVTPDGTELTIPIDRLESAGGCACCMVRKDSGDDPDVTDSLLIAARICKNNTNDITIKGGSGVGRVTKKGLSCPVGSAAINAVPRKMITEAVKQACVECGYTGGIDVEISVPEGEKIAKRTFNPRLGIEGGISILGTTGIVEPMSEKALVDSIRLEMNMLRENGADYMLLTPGNYGESFLKDDTNLNGDVVVKCSNYIGEALDCAVDLGVQGILLVGHIGKLVKLAGGIMNTHSRIADGRMEILAAYAASVGAGQETANRILQCITTDEALAVLDETDLRERTIQRLMERIHFHMDMRLGGSIPCAAVMFSNQYGILGKTAQAKWLMDKLKKQ